MMKHLSIMTLEEIMESFKKYLDLYYNHNITPDDNNYIPVNIDEPPDYEYKRAVIIECSDKDSTIWESNKQKAINILLHIRWNPRLIKKELPEGKTFTQINAQGEMDRLRDKIMMDIPHPFTNTLNISGINGIELSKDLFSYFIHIKTYIK